MIPKVWCSDWPPHIILKILDSSVPMHNPRKDDNSANNCNWRFQIEMETKRQDLQTAAVKLIYKEISFSLWSFFFSFCHWVTYKLYLTCNITVNLNQIQNKEFHIHTLTLICSVLQLMSFGWVSRGQKHQSAVVSLVITGLGLMWTTLSWRTLRLKRIYSYGPTSFSGAMEETGWDLVTSDFEMSSIKAYWGFKPIKINVNC